MYVIFGTLYSVFLLSMAEMYEEAESTFRSAISAMADNPHFYYSLGVLMGRVQKLEVKAIRLELQWNLYNQST